MAHAGAQCRYPKLKFQKGKPQCSNDGDAPFASTNCPAADEMDIESR